MNKFKNDLIKLGACSIELEIANGYGFDVKDKRALQSPYKIMWLISRRYEQLGLTLQDVIKYSISAARVTAKLNKDPRVMAAIKSAEMCIENPTQENQAWAAARAAAAAWAAARAAAEAEARAAAAAEAAAWAAAWAAARAAAEAEAAAEAAAWAADAAADSDLSTQLKDLFAPLRQKLVEYYSN